MPGPRQPLAALETRGRKHLSQAEKNAREATEVRAEPPKFVRPPKYLPEIYKDEFTEISRQLIPLVNFVKFDRDALAKYLIARGLWAAATQKVLEAVGAGMVTAAKEWATVQKVQADQMDKASNMLGLNPASRCRMIVQKPAEREEESPMLDNISKLFG